MILQSCKYCLCTIWLKFKTNLYFGGKYKFKLSTHLIIVHVEKYIKFNLKVEVTN